MTKRRLISLFLSAIIPVIDPTIESKRKEKPRKFRSSWENIWPTSVTPDCKAINAKIQKVTHIKIPQRIDVIRVYEGFEVIFMGNSFFSKLFFEIQFR